MRFQQRPIWALPIALALVLLVVVGLSLPRLLALYELLASEERLHSLWYEEVGLSEAASRLLAIVGGIGLSVLWVPLTFWTYRASAWRFNLLQLGAASVGWAVVYGHVPAIHWLFGQEQCFNQRTGHALKWYIEAPTGEIVLFDSPGFDTGLGAEKRLVTPHICAVFTRQKLTNSPKRITADVRAVEFFDGNTGRARVWYLRSSSGAFLLFDRGGFDPTTGDSLQAVTRQIVDEILRQAQQAAEEAGREAARIVEVRQQRLEQERRDLPAQARADVQRKEDTGTSSESQGQSWGVTRPSLRASSDQQTAGKTGLVVVARPPLPLAGPASPGWVAVLGRPCWVWAAHPGQRRLSATWSGECRNGFASGSGRQAWLADGERIVWGEVENLSGHAIGTASLVTANGSRYEGRIVDWRPNGFGTFVSIDGRSVSGVWADGCLSLGPGAWARFLRIRGSCGP